MRYENYFKLFELQRIVCEIVYILLLTNVFLFVFDRCYAGHENMATENELIKNRERGESL